jgi:enamine deaminase RidA (YjgF/YER057c/UK114 family)
LENLNVVLGAADTSLEHAVKSQNLMVDLEDWKDINRIWGRYMIPPPPPRTSASVASLITPGARVMANVVAVVPGSGNRKEDVRAGLRFHVSEHGYAFSPAIQTRDWISLAGHLSFDYENFALIGANPRMPHLYSEIEVQVDGIMADRLEILEANGASTADIFEARVYLCHPRRDYRGFVRAWRRWFPDDDHAPVVHVIPVTGLHFEGTIVEIELMAARP